MALEEIGTTSRGYTIYVEDAPHGGREYWSDEIGGGVRIHDTMIDAESIMMALNYERMIEKKSIV